MKNKKTVPWLLVSILFFASVLSYPEIVHAQASGCPADMIHYWKLDEANFPYEDSYGTRNATCTICPTAT
ncbi:MAG: hypothetical protein WA610_15120, partial [Thermodesulfovibrionales bacterium]